MPDSKYHDHREGQERAAAGVAANPAIARLHRELADKHAELAAAIRAQERESEVKISS